MSDSTVPGSLRGKLLADSIVRDGNKSVSGRDVLLFDRVIGGVGYRVAMEVRPGRRVLAFASLRKKPGAW